MQYTLFINSKTRLEEMPQWVEACVTKPKNPSLIPRTHVTEYYWCNDKEQDSPRAPVGQAHESERSASLPGPASEGRLGLECDILDSCLSLPLTPFTELVN